VGQAKHFEHVFPSPFPSQFGSNMGWSEPKKNEQRSVWGAHGEVAYPRVPKRTTVCLGPIARDTL
jgi:hypothetical protein